jgi:hypothetical protein
MCKGHAVCGWGEALEPYWHTVLCCLLDVGDDGLRVNHYAWTHQGAGDAHTVGTWPRYNGGTWCIDIGHIENVCVVRVSLPNSGMMPVVEWEIIGTRAHRTIDRRLDVILQDKGAT